ncbi:MAG: AzlD domain-containing protein [Planktomarina sp.]
MTQAFSDATLWTVIICLGIGSWGLRFSFLALLGDRDLPDWVLRHLRYTAVAILPGLVMPLVIWPDATGGQPDPARITAAVATVAVGYWSKNLIAAFGTGLLVLYSMLFLAA